MNRQTNILISSTLNFRKKKRVKFSLVLVWSSDVSSTVLSRIYFSSLAVERFASELWVILPLSRYRHSFLDKIEMLVVHCWDSCQENLLSARHCSFCWTPLLCNFSHSHPMHSPEKNYRFVRVHTYCISILQLLTSIFGMFVLIKENSCCRVFGWVGDATWLSFVDFSTALYSECEVVPSIFGVLQFISWSVCNSFSSICCTDCKVPEKKYLKKLIVSRTFETF